MLLNLINTVFQINHKILTMFQSVFAQKNGPIHYLLTVWFCKENPHNVCWRLKFQYSIICHTRRQSNVKASTYILKTLASSHSCKMGSKKEARKKIMQINKMHWQNKKKKIIVLLSCFVGVITRLGLPLSF